MRLVIGNLFGLAGRLYLLNHPNLLLRGASLRLCVAFLFGHYLPIWMHRWLRTGSLIFSSRRIWRLYSMTNVSSLTANHERIGAFGDDGNIPARSSYNLKEQSMNPTVLFADDPVLTFARRGVDSINELYLYFPLFRPSPADSCSESRALDPTSGQAAPPPPRTASGSETLARGGWGAPGCSPSCQRWASAAPSQARPRGSPGTASPDGSPWQRRRAVRGKARQCRSFYLEVAMPAPDRRLAATLHGRAAWRQGCGRRRVGSQGDRWKSSFS